MAKEAVKFRKKQKMASAIITATMVASSTAGVFANEVQEVQVDENVVQEQIIEEAEEVAVEETVVEEEAEEVAVEETVVEEEVEEVAVEETVVEEEVEEVAVEETVVEEEVEEVAVEETVVEKEEVVLEETITEETEAVSEETEKKPSDHLSHKQREAIKNLDKMLANLKESKGIEEFVRVRQAMLNLINEVKLPEKYTSYYKNQIEEAAPAQWESVKNLEKVLGNLKEAKNIEEFVRVRQAMLNIIKEANLPSSFNEYYENQIEEAAPAQWESVKNLEQMLGYLNDAKSFDEFIRIREAMLNLMETEGLPDSFNNYYKEQIASNEYNVHIEKIEYLEQMLGQLKDSKGIEEFVRIRQAILNLMKESNLPESVNNYYNEEIEKAAPAEWESVKNLEQMLGQLKGAKGIEEFIRIRQAMLNLMKEAGLPDSFNNYYKEQIEKAAPAEWESVKNLEQMLGYLNEAKNFDEFIRIRQAMLNLMKEAGLPDSFNNYYKEQIAANPFNVHIEKIEYLEQMLGQLKDAKSFEEAIRIRQAMLNLIKEVGLPDSVNSYYKEQIDNSEYGKQFEAIDNLETLLDLLENTRTYEEFIRRRVAIFNLLSESGLPENVKNYYYQEVAKLELSDVQWETVAKLESLINQLKDITDYEEFTKLKEEILNLLDQSNLPERFVNYLEDELNKIATPDQPGEGEDQPGEGEDQPGEGEDQPGEGEDQPGEGEDQPGEGEDQPGEGEDQPGEGEDQPGEDDEDQIDKDQTGTTNKNDSNNESVQTGDPSLVGYAGLGLLGTLGLAFRRRK